MVEWSSGRVFYCFTLMPTQQLVGRKLGLGAPSVLRVFSIELPVFKGKNKSKIAEKINRVFECSSVRVVEWSSGRVVEWSSFLVR